ncbi:hypothetical protein [Pseudomonas sp. ANT_H12B]|uniref:hypothetical protein n=1 Tax=Pseudomonas sp. ANT_H12B TaxID=2597348 RepID=UPI0011EFD2AA|nr:hypothetical protein [Pseudomonas sp. ANT_H12B]KAA0963081.1 hypothetical protein FQ185_24510 [Pseudomonas sp. ANT_H12B]
MSEKPLTPGPWAVHRRMKDCVTFTGKHGEENLFLENVDGYFACQSPTDARLISAAPELLRAARKVLAGLNARIDEASASGSLVPVFDGIAELHDAITKATQ